MTTNRDLILARKRFESNLALDQEIYRGKIITIERPDGSSSVFVENKRGYVWVLSEMGNAWQVRNRRVSAIAGTDVLIGRAPKPPHRMQILEWNDENVVDLEDEQPLLPLHHEAHEQWNGGSGYDPVTVYTRMLADGKVYLDEDVSEDNLTMSINVASMIYVRGDRFITFGRKLNQDITPYLPPAGLKWWLLVYVNRLTNVLSYTVGPVVVDIPTLNPAYPTVPANAIPLAFILLESSAAGIYEEYNIRDARQPVGGSANMPAATLSGQVLYSVDGVSFAAGLPVTGEFGWLVEENTGILIVADSR